MEDMGHGWDEDIFLMKHTKISDLVEDEKQKLIYVFDPLTDRSLFIEFIVLGRTMGLSANFVRIRSVTVLKKISPLPFVNADLRQRDRKSVV